MSGLLILCVYALGLLPSAVAATRGLHAQREYCHQEPRFCSAHRWTNKGDCARYCRQGCWRSDAGQPITLGAASLGSVLAFLWPLLLMPVLVLVLSNHQPRRRALNDPTSAVDLDREIARLERDLGIGGS